MVELPIPRPARHTSPRIIPHDPTPVVCDFGPSRAPDIHVAIPAANETEGSADRQIAAGWRSCYGSGRTSTGSPVFSSTRSRSPSGSASSTITKSPQSSPPGGSSVLTDIVTSSCSSVADTRLSSALQAPIWSTSVRSLRSSASQISASHRPPQPSTTVPAATTAVNRTVERRKIIRTRLPDSQVQQRRRQAPSGSLRLPRFDGRFVMRRCRRRDG